MWGTERAGALGKAQKLVKLVKLVLARKHVLQVSTAHCDGPATDCGIAVGRAVPSPREGRMKVTPSSLALSHLQATDCDSIAHGCSNVGAAAQPGSSCLASDRACGARTGVWTARALVLERALGAASAALSGRLRAICSLPRTLLGAGRRDIAQSRVQQCR